MARYRKLPVVIEATQWERMGDHPTVTRYTEFVEVEAGARCGVNEERPGCGRLYEDHGWCPTLEGAHIVCPGDWIITGVKGEQYPCKPDIFARTYEPAPTEGAPTGRTDDAH